MIRRRLALLIVLAAALVTIAAAAGPASALVRNGTHGWYWQMPQPASSVGMADVAYSGDGGLWTAGSGGLVMHSTDGGRTWAEQPVGTGADLWAVQFVGAQHGVVCGDSVVFSTSDGGATWSGVTPPAALAPAGFSGVEIVDASHLGVATADGAVLRTADGGATWTRSPLGDYAGSVACDFTDAVHGYAVGDGGLIWKTADGGATWSQLAPFADSSSELSKVAFWDARHGWAWAYSQRSQEMSLLATSDGGAHWRTSPGVSWVDDLVPTGKSSAWVLYSGYALWLEPVLMQHTIDAGRHWEDTSVSVPASPHALAVRGDDLCAVGDAVILSDDGGKDWLPASSGQAPWISGIAVRPGGDLWATDFAGSLLHSSDGVRWSEQALPERWSASLRAVTFADADHGWAVGSDSLYGENSVILATADGGATWAPQQSNLSGPLAGVDFLDARTGWTISDQPNPFGSGANTCIQRTLDGGETWIPLFVASNASLSAVQFLDADTGWAAGAYGPADGSGKPTLFSTTNGGFTWTKHALPKEAPVMTGLQFVDASEGWAVGTAYDDATQAETGWAFHTTDGGTTWTRVEALSDSLPTVVHFVDAQHGYVGGDNGVWSTSDGGATWVQVAPGYGIYALAATDTAHVWAGGLGFLTSTVDSAGDTAAPTTLLQGGISSWWRKDAVVKLVAGDPGGSGVAATEYRVDGSSTWQTGSTVTVPAPADHANDGDHLVYYRSRDNAGNAELTEITGVGIDTLGPACSVYRTSTVNSGDRGILYFTAFDGTSGVRRASITATDARGRTVLRIGLHRGNWDSMPSPSYFWWPFTCKLAPGTYRLQVRAVDVAGNAQVLVGRGKLRVVKSGARAPHRPSWPAGLSYSGSGYGGRQAAASSTSAELPMLWRPVLATVETAALPQPLLRQRLHLAAH
jgi:photosystem II stability/assembly factor-like uncharacterized protein